MFLAWRHARRPWVPEQALAGRDRRIFQRVPLSADCRLRHVLYGLDCEGRTLNISLGGLGLHAPVSWPEGSRVRVQMKDLNWEADALIVFRMERSGAAQHGCLFGLKFQNLSGRALWQLHRYLRRCHRGALVVS